MAPNGNRQMLMQLATSIIAAAILSIGAAVVSVKVMGADLDRAKADLHEVDASARQQAIAIAEIKAVAVATTRSENDRWDEVQRLLESIEEDQKELLLRMPRARRDIPSNR